MFTDTGPESVDPRGVEVAPGAKHAYYGHLRPLASSTHELASPVAASYSARIDKQTAEGLQGIAANLQRAGWAMTGGTCGCLLIALAVLLLIALFAS